MTEDEEFEALEQRLKMQDKPKQREIHPFEQLYIDCCVDSVTYGMGIICIQNHPEKGMDITRVHPKDWGEFAQALEWNMKNRIEK